MKTRVLLTPDMRLAGAFLWLRLRCLVGQGFRPAAGLPPGVDRYAEASEFQPAPHRTPVQATAAPNAGKKPGRRPEALPHRAGITLIEVLIAMSLLSFLSIGMLLAMRIGFNTMDKTDAHLVQNRKVANVRKIVEDEIAGFTFTRAEWHPDPQDIVTVLFMQFEPAVMRFVTGYSLHDAWRGRPQIAVLQVVPGEGNVGVRLIVNEIPYTGPAQAGLMVTGVEPGPLAQLVHFAPIPAGSDSFVLADKLAYCRFSYLEPRSEPPFQLWRPDWVRADLPLGIRIEMAPLDNGPAELHMSTVTVSLPVNRGPNLWYYDADQ